MCTMKKTFGLVWTLLIVGGFLAETASARFLFFGKPMTPEERMERYQELEAQKQAAEREKREAREAARARKEEEARIKRLSSEAKKQAKEEIDALEGQLKEEKAQAKAEYKQSLAGASKEEKEFLKMQYKEEIAEIEQRHKERVAKVHMSVKRKIADAMVESLDLPVDTSTRYTATDIQISGNNLISTAELLREMPSIYNASDMPITETESVNLYDLRPVQDVILEPGQTHEVSARTIQGLTQYLLSVYQEENYAGIYVYVPQDRIVQNRLVDNILHIEVLEASVSSISVDAYEPNQTPKEKGYLTSTGIIAWSPVKVGEVADEKALNDFVNLLNLNPDRYVSAVVSRGVTPGSLSVNYDVYEANPWHWFVQVDNAGTKDRQWNPRIGLINTNLLGFDDTFTAVYQSAFDKTWDEEYSVYGSYDFPIMGPKTRLKLYAGYSQYETKTTGITDFFGKGYFAGGEVRHNVLQHEGWFFDARGMMEYVESEVKDTDLFGLTDSAVHFTMWGAGPELHRRDDKQQSTVSFTFWKSLGGGSDGTAFNQARNGADSIFEIYDFYANHSQFIDPNNVQRVTGTFRWIGTDERVVPARMTSFGGMYTVRGYDEYEVVADGGILASVQYEYDIVQAMKAKEGVQLQDPETGETPFVRKVAPLTFFDYGRSAVRHPQPGLGEKRHVELMSVGGGIITELGDNFTGAVYYGYPLNATDDTREGKGRVNTSLLFRF